MVHVERGEGGGGVSRDIVEWQYKDSPNEIYEMFKFLNCDTTQFLKLWHSPALLYWLETIVPLHVTKPK